MKLDPFKPDPFRPAWWLPGPHLQSAWVLARPRRRLVEYRREVLATPDGDELVLDHVDGAGDAAGSPRVLLLHGLEGSSTSLHMQQIAAAVSAMGWRVTAMNFRSCARDPLDESCWLPNRKLRLYHSGETTDLAHVVETLLGREPSAPLFAYGISLGGNVLLKYLGETGEGCPLAGGVSVSAPYDLLTAARNLESPIGLLYTRYYLDSLRPKMERIAGLFSETSTLVDLPRVRRARTFFDFDDAAVAPLHGFTGADDYYARSSSLGFLPRVRKPALAISSADDPFSPPRVLEAARQAASSSAELLVTPGGGHVGFVEGPAPWLASFWHVRAAVAWIDRQLG